MAFKKGDRVWYEDDVDYGQGTVTSVDEFDWGQIVYVKWDDGTPECGLPDDELSLLED